MDKKENNYAFIDSQNVNLSITYLGWKLDMYRFRLYLKEKYNVKRAYLFIGYIPEKTKLYTALHEAGFICIFKTVLNYKNGTIKGNCDAELVLQAMIEYSHYDKAVIVTGDGDFHCLVKYLIDNRKLIALMIPNQMRFSALLRVNGFRPYLRYMNGLREKLENKKGPARTKP